MRRRALIAFAVLAVSGIASTLDRARAGTTREMIVCYPGKPGTAKAAANVMATFTEHLATKAGFEPGSLQATYFNEEAPALEFVKEKRPAFGILSVALYLKWRAAGERLSILAQSERGGRSTDCYHVYVAPGSARHVLADLKGGVLVSTHLQDARFATKVVFAGALDASTDVAVVSTKDMVGALKTCARKKPMSDGRALDGFVFDDAETEGWAKKPEFMVLQKLWSSRPLPTPPVVSFTDNATKEDASKLVVALLGMAKDAEGQKILAELQATGFNPITPEAYAQVEKAY